jgi:benzoyl-CoA reductase/2-hydroxyglutaryl-CoA dehydratase subunit BcrC/BadD/HgdB
MLLDPGNAIGLTSTVPVEVVLAAGLVPVDLNNRFIIDPDRERMVVRAEARGFPVNLCSWIKGLYTSAHDLGLRRVVGVVRGDCSSTEKLLEVLRWEGIATVEFAYPLQPGREAMAQAIASFAAELGTTVAAAERMREQLRPIRGLLAELDELTWRDGLVKGQENHLWLVTASDFSGSPARFAAGLHRFLDEVRRRRPRRDFIRLGYLGVPPIVDGLHEFLEQRGARVIYNEVQRQFAMPGSPPDLATQYASYTYPYDTLKRMEDVKRECQRRELRGLIHYAQTFCHRQIEAIIFREGLGLPVITIEADRPGPLDARTQTRLEAFLEQLA